ncbi:MAG: phosphoglucomutase [Candidatus Tokpelaia sp. JSC188]|nr:MAG: phosphoglucomutase [Candidatus Tokpelaia sp. JSC188]
MIQAIITKPFADQDPGTSGLRKKVKIFETPHYTENFIQSIFDCTGKSKGKRLIVGGDGRFFNQQVIQKVLKIAAANGFASIMVGKGGILSTPAVSHLIQKYKAHGGIILSASHNPGGSDGDFGIKYNIASGGPAPEKVTKGIYACSQKIRCYRIANVGDIDLDRLGHQEIGGMKIEIVDPVRDYADLMEKLFDFQAIRQAIADGLRFRFDAMHAVSGPYAHEIFEKRLGFPTGTVIKGQPLPDFGNKNPDPNPVHAKDLIDLLMSDGGPDFGAASDGDGDRNLVIGKGIFITPSDSLAILAANAHLVKGYRAGVAGVARSMPTSTAIDRVAKKHRFFLYETPTGWKFFCNLLDMGLITLCGEESFGTGSSHVLEKDGLWAILMWLNILSITGKSALDIVRNHWREYGRNYYSRHDYEEVDTAAAKEMMKNLHDRLESLPGMEIGGFKIEKADEFVYHDPVDCSVSHNQGLRILFKNGSRIVFRLSGTGTQGATVRVYMERYEADPVLQEQNTQKALSTLISIADEIGNLKLYLNRNAPTVIT